LTAAYNSSGGTDASPRISDRIARACRVASTTLPVPASFGPDHRRARVDPARRLAEVGRPDTNGTVNAHLFNW